MNAPKVGDRVRVVIEGQVNIIDDDYFVIGSRGTENTIFPDAEHVVSVEILRPPVKVWDVIETAEQLDALPLGAVVHCKRQCAAERYAGGWYETADETGTFNAELLPATVLYLPDGAA